MFSKSESPVHDELPSLKMVLFGPCALLTSPVDKTTPLLNGKFGLVFSKYPIPFEDPTEVPVFEL